METAVTLDDQARRDALALQIRDHFVAVFGLALPECSDAESMRALVRRASATGAIEASLGVRIEPPFPGFAEAPEAMGPHWRMICMARVHVGERILGTLISTLVSGRRPSVIVAASDAHIPPHFVPLIR